MGGWAKDRGLHARSDVSCYYSGTPMPRDSPGIDIHPELPWTFSFTIFQHSSECSGAPKSLQMSSFLPGFTMVPKFFLLISQNPFFLHVSSVNARTFSPKLQFSTMSTWFLHVVLQVPLMWHTQCHKPTFWDDRTPNHLWQYWGQSMALGLPTLIIGQFIGHWPSHICIQWLLLSHIKFLYTNQAP